LLTARTVTEVVALVRANPGKYGAPPEVFAKQLTNESATWREVIRASGLKMQ
jgi:hypothetical protein